MGIHELPQNAQVSPMLPLLFEPAQTVPIFLGAERPRKSKRQTEGLGTSGVASGQRSNRRGCVLWGILPRDVRTAFCPLGGVFRIKPLKVKLLAGEQKATEYSRLTTFELGPSAADTSKGRRVMWCRSLRFQPLAQIEPLDILRTDRFARKKLRPFRSRSNLTSHWPTTCLGTF